MGYQDYDGLYEVDVSGYTRPEFQHAISMNDGICEIWFSDEPMPIVDIQDGSLSSVALYNESGRDNFDPGSLRYLSAVEEKTLKTALRNSIKFLD